MTQPLSLSRRNLLKGVLASGTLGLSSAPVFAAAKESDEVWTGYTICDSCNHMPMCGLQFKARGNHVIKIENWKEHPNNSLCSKGISTLQRLYNPNRLLYPLKRTIP